MTLEINQNSYVGIEDADQYFSARLYAEKWTDADISTREKALGMAATMLDLNFQWAGKKADSDQAMEFPREGMAEPPRAIKVAQMELALLLLKSDLTAIPENAGVKREKLDVLETEYFESYKPELVPDNVKSLITPFLALQGAVFSVTR